MPPEALLDTPGDRREQSTHPPAKENIQQPELQDPNPPEFGLRRRHLPLSFSTGVGKARCCRMTLAGMKPASILEFVLRDEMRRKDTLYVIINHGVVMRPATTRCIRTTRRALEGTLSE
jgi:hypothetical protein